MRKKFNELIVVQQNGYYHILILTGVNITESEIELYEIDGYNAWSNKRQKQRGGGLIVYK